MTRPRVVVLCGQRPRHLFVANTLAEHADVVAVVHEQGRQWTRKKIKRMLRPSFLLKKIKRRLRDRKGPTFADEARFFFGDAAAALNQPETRVFVPLSLIHI